MTTTSIEFEITRMAKVIIELPDGATITLEVPYTPGYYVSTILELALGITK